MLHGSQEWGGKGLGRLKRGLGVSHGSQEYFFKMKYENGCVCVSHDSQEWGGKGLGRPAMKHEQGVGCFSKAQNEA